MIIRNILEKLESSVHPVAKSLIKSEDQKVTVLAFKAGMSLKNHSTPFPATLMVLEGHVIYREEDKETALHKFDDTSIAAGIVHAVDCIEDAVCLLLQSKTPNV